MMKFRLFVGMALALAVGIVTPATALAQGAADAAKAKLKIPAAFTEQAPDTYKATFETSKGSFTIDVHRAWAPRGADRFYNLVKSGFYEDCRFFRVLNDFMAQIGINGDPAVSAAWRDARIADDPVKQSN